MSAYISETKNQSTRSCYNFPTRNTITIPAQGISPQQSPFPAALHNHSPSACLAECFLVLVDHSLRIYRYTLSIRKWTESHNPILGRSWAKVSSLVPPSPHNAWLFWRHLKKWPDVSEEHYTNNNNNNNNNNNKIIKITNNNNNSTWSFLYS